MIVGSEGPGVLISARTAAFLERYAGLAALRVKARGVMPEIAAELTDVREAARLFRPLPASAEAEADSAGVRAESWLTTTQVADLAQVSDSAVRLACRVGRISGTYDTATRCWQIPEPEARQYVAQRKARTT